MVRDQGGRWDVSIKDNAVCVERISESDERVFDDLLRAEEARDLAGLLTKYATKLDESEDSGKGDESKADDKSEDAEQSEEKSEDTDDSDDSEKSEMSDDSDDETDEKAENKSDDSDDSSD
ncbi:hypothetical protein MMAN_26150 [Mycobacterium mantenii]|uniref:Uncharacterized protein n=1 Tax=Mycobacterium mantenii TaxID=560555 RepID=A0A1X0F8K2_MYCNT|nr:hypothetical protein [Mycobacterium mantenii]MCV7243023.1 hypothetical protein [Mycobacterium mantenii]ORA98050.1 hypothetical protein BST30_26260 [Mycobacterium mantenii]BBY38481.1 hypothetical protein MMAN_26150 [Mycobacterium mantenii]